MRTRPPVTAKADVVIDLAAAFGLCVVIAFIAH